MTEHRPTAATLRTFAAAALILVVASVQFSIAVGQSIFAIAAAGWLAVMAIERRSPRAPRFALPLAAYAAVTLFSAALSADPTTSLADCKQLLLLLMVPMTYELMSPGLAPVAATAVMSAGAVSGVFGIGQYAVLNYDNLDLRPRSTLGMYMTFSGLTMLVVGLALAQVLFARRGRTWPALIVPALAVALIVTLTRSTWLGASAAVLLLLLLKDFRLLVVLPVVAAAFFLVAPDAVTQRFYSIFDLENATNRDRLAMLAAGEKIVRDHPLTGIGPNMMMREYPSYRVPDAVVDVAPHLHNVPMQIAAERGLPALAIWLAFVILLTVDLRRLYRTGAVERWLPAAGLASVVAMVIAGLFEYNFGDSEFQMLFLFLVTLPFAAARTDR